MKRIRNKVLDNPFTGEPMVAGYGVEKDGQGKTVYIQQDDGSFLLDPNGQKIPKPLTKSQTTALAVRHFLQNAIPASKELTLTDSHHALRVLDSLSKFKLTHAAFYEKQPKTIDLEDADYDWLLRVYKERSPQFHGILAEVFVDAIEDLEKVEEPKEESSENGSKPKLVKGKA